MDIGELLDYKPPQAVKRPPEEDAESSTEKNA